VKRAVARFCCVLSVLLGLTAPIVARGDDTPQPVPANRQCSVPADPQWTPQENFVWQRVCVGEVADFNKGPNYGGNLDPKTPQGLPESRILRPAFLETILSDDKYRNILTRRGITIIGARLTNTLDLKNVQLRNEFELHWSILEKGANFSGLRSTYSISLTGSKITGPLVMEGLQVERNLNMRAMAQVGGVRFVGAYVGGQLTLSGSQITSPLLMDELQVGQTLFMDGAQFGDVGLVNVHVGGQLNLVGSKVTGTIVIQGVQVYSTVHLSRGAEFDGPVSFIFSKVGQNVELAGGFFRQDVEFGGTQIDGELRLGRSDHGPARWSPNSMLTLRNTSVGALQDLPNSWPDKLDLNGFTYRNLGGLSGPDPDPMINRTPEWFEDWLGKQASYAPAPYQQLASVLRERGRSDTADEVLYAGKERELAQSSSLSYLGLTLSKLFIGHGYHKFWSVYWALGFLVAGTLVLQFSSQRRRISRHYTLFHGLFYSFDLLLPIIRLREKHYQIDLRGGVRYYFYLHKIMGYVLATFLIAGIAGLTK
jgi:hypothetical protein